MFVSRNSVLPILLAYTISLSCKDSGKSSEQIPRINYRRFRGQYSSLLCLFTDILKFRGVNFKINAYRVLGPNLGTTILIWDTVQFFSLLLNLRPIFVRTKNS